MTEVETKERLEALISEEREALINGDFEKIAELMEEKEEMTQDLSDLRLPAGELAPIKNGLRRNQELFDEALKGIRRVSARLVELQTVRKSINTYDALGRGFSIDVPSPNKLEKRA